MFDVFEKIIKQRVASTGVDEIRKQFALLTQGEKHEGRADS